mmetsp:Transcript_15637/g.33842  ORF Transcript_15637/g.33842 Transcript_15637/m.33842 type:complete len:1028 (-) Transcript_15637:2196-5279(-)
MCKVAALLVSAALISTSSWEPSAINDGALALITASRVSIGGVEAFILHRTCRRIGRGTRSFSTSTAGSRSVTSRSPRVVVKLANANSSSSTSSTSPDTDSLVKVYGGTGSDSGNGSSSGRKRKNTSSSNRQSNDSNNSSRRNRASPQNRRNDGGGSGRSGRSNSSTAASSKRIPRSSREARQPPARETKKEEQEAFRAKLQEMHNKSARGEELSQSHCDEILGLCVATDEWDSVLEVLAVMKTQGLSQTKSSYRACLEQCSKANNGASAGEILVAMKQAGIEPDLDDIALAVKTMCRSGSWRRARSLLLETVAKASVEGSVTDGSSGETAGVAGNDEDDNSIADTEPSDKADSNTTMSIEAYNAVISGMKGERMWKDALQFLSLMEKGHAGANNNLEKMRKEDKTAVVSSNPHPQPTLVTYNHALEACVSSAEAEQAVRLLMSMRDKGMEPSPHTFELVVRGLLKRSQWRRALQVLDLMEEWGVPQSTRIFNTVISACTKAREVGQAMDLLKKMRSANIKPDVVTYNAILSACASTGRWKDALRLLQQCQREPGVSPDIITYTNAMRACARARKYKDALELLEVLQDLGLKPDVYCYTAAIDACAKGRMWRKALELLSEMKDRGVAPNEVTYSVAITACGNGGQWRHAMNLLNQMREKGLKINVITYSSTISALAKGARRVRDDSTDGTAGDELWVKALDLLDQMKKEGVEPDAYSYSGAISACASAGRWEEALDLLATMKKGGPKTRPNKITYTAAISACGRAGEYEHALRLFEDMRNDGIAADRISYNAVVSALRVGQQAEKAYEIWGEMCGRKGSRNVTSRKNKGASKPIASATSDPRLSPDIITLTDVIATLERSEGAENRQRMDEVFNEAVERGIILPADSLDSTWEVDLSGMSIPVAHAACRYIVQRALREVKGGRPCEDLLLITGVGKGQQQQAHHDDSDLDREENNLSAAEEDEGNGPTVDLSPPLGLKGRGSTSLREYVRQVLRDDHDPQLYSTIPPLSQGTVKVSGKVFQQWADAQT